MWVRGAVTLTVRATDAGSRDLSALRWRTVPATGRGGACRRASANRYRCWIDTGDGRDDTAATSHRIVLTGEDRASRRRDPATGASPTRAELDPYDSGRGDAQLRYDNAEPAPDVLEVPRGVKPALVSARIAPAGTAGAPVKAYTYSWSYGGKPAKAGTVKAAKLVRGLLPIQAYTVPKTATNSEPRRELRSLPISLRISATDELGNRSATRTVVSTHPCYRSAATPFEWPYAGDLDTGATNAPPCRVTPSSGVFDDQWTETGTSTSGGPRFFMPRFAGAWNATSKPKLEEARWELVDSFKNPIADLGARRIPLSNQLVWAVYKPHSNDLIGTSQQPFVTSAASSVPRRGPFVTQGRACMADERWESGFRLISFKGNDGTDPNDPAATVDLGIRGFIATLALDPASVNVRNDVDCGRSTLPASPGPSVVLDGERFQRDDRYVSESSGGTRCNPLDPDRQGVTPAGVGYGSCGSYDNYAGPPGIDVLAITTATTAVEGGGIVRALVPFGTRARLLAATSYCDPNVPKDTIAVGRYGQPRRQANRALWWLVRVGRIAGWVPRPVSTVPSGVPGRPAGCDRFP